MNESAVAIAEATTEKLNQDCPRLLFIHKTHNYVPYPNVANPHVQDTRRIDSIHTYIYDRRKGIKATETGTGRIDYHDASAVLVVSLSVHRWHEDVHFEYADPDFYNKLLVGCTRLAHRCYST